MVKHIPSGKVCCSIVYRDEGAVYMYVVIAYHNHCMTACVCIIIVLCEDVLCELK